LWTRAQEKHHGGRVQERKAAHIMVARKEGGRKRGRKDVGEEGKKGRRERLSSDLFPPTRLYLLIRHSAMNSSMG
jgi:hypothetical protein